MIMKRYAIFFDLDGTLMEDVHHLYPRIETTLERLKENGHLCFVATGRGYSSIPAPLKSIMNGFVTLTGAGCIFDGKKIIEHRIPKECIDQMAELSFSIGAPMFIQNDERADMIISPDFEYEEDVYNMDSYVASYYRSMEEYRNGDINVGKVDTRSIFRKQVEKLPCVVSGELTTLDTADGWLEVLLSNLNKGTAIRELCEHIGHDIGNTVCFGDSENDLAMFEVCGIPIAVSNAMEEVKQKASIVLEGNNQDAVIGVLHELELI